MGSPEVEWVLSAIASNMGMSLSDLPLERVDRDESELLKGNIRTHKADLKSSNYVGASLVDRGSDPVGTGYDHAVEAVVGLRIEGLHESEWGKIDPDGVDGIPFDELVQRVRKAILVDRVWPDVGRADTTYTDLQIANEAPQSADFADYYRYDFDVVFSGYEDL